MITAMNKELAGSAKLLLICFVLAALLPRCDGGGSDVTRIGVINSLTGSAAPYGQAAQKGLKLAEVAINNSGGVLGKKMVLVVEDDQTTPSNAVSAFKKLVAVDKVPIIIGPLSSSSAMACAPLANEMKTVILSSGAATPQLTGAGDYVFRNRAAGQLEAVQIAEFAFKTLALRRIVIFYINTDYGVGFKNVFQDRFQAQGGSIVHVESFDQGMRDFKSQLVKIEKYKPDGVYILGVPIEVGYILKQAAELGLRTKYLMNNMEDPNLLTIAGKSAEGVFFAIPLFDPESADSITRGFVDWYKKEYGVIPDMFSADAYDALFLAKLAIEKGGYDGNGIKDALYGIKDYHGADGVITFDRNGEVIKPLVIKTVRDGKFEIYK